MKLKTTMALYATAAGGQSGGSSLVNKPGAVEDTPAVRDKARERLVRPFASPDVDAEQEVLEKNPQTDSAAFTGKKYRVQDTHYGHFTSEHDNEASASLAEETRPYSRILRTDVPRDTKRSRQAAFKKSQTVNPDVE